jgi:hypothetical protein
MRSASNVLLNPFDTSNLVSEQWHLDHMEIVDIEIVDLSEIFLLHGKPDPAMLAVRPC